VSESLNCSGQALPNVPNRRRFNELASHIQIPIRLSKSSLSLSATAFNCTLFALVRQPQSASSAQSIGPPNQLPHRAFSPRQASSSQQLGALLPERTSSGDRRVTGTTISRKSARRQPSLTPITMTRRGPAPLG